MGILIVTCRCRYIGTRYLNETKREELLLFCYLDGLRLLKRLNVPYRRDCKENQPSNWRSMGITINKKDVNVILFIVFLLNAN